MSSGPVSMPVSRRIQGRCAHPTSRSVAEARNGVGSPARRHWRSSMPLADRTSRSCRTRSPSGTQQVWVVRLIGPRRVEVYRPGESMRLVGPGEILSAPGLLRNPVPIEALYDRDAAHRATLRNLLQREGYESLDAVRQAGVVDGINQGISQGIAESILALLSERGLVVDLPIRERILAEHDPAQLRRWLIAATQVQEATRLFD